MTNPHNTTRIEHRIDTRERESKNRHLGGVLWLTGLSGAGKSTLAFALEERLFRMHYQAYVLDGDNIRHGLSSDLGFAPVDRTENIRRVGETAALFADAGFICIAAFISPYRDDRIAARRAAGENFHEIFVRADLSVCEGRDPKGLYRKARAGLIEHFTAIDDRYEEPEEPSLVVDTTTSTIHESLETLIAYVTKAFAVDAR